MAGRKQHHIPQFLLRGFAAIGSGKKPMLTVFSRDKPIFTVSTDGVAAGRYFYSRPEEAVGSESLDEDITDLEQRLVPVLQRYRSLDSTTALDSAQAAELVTHLTIRTAHVREVMADALAGMMEGVRTTFTSPEAMKSHFDFSVSRPSELATMILDEGYRTMGERLGLTRAQFDLFAYPKLKAAGPTLEKVLGPIVEMFIRKLMDAHQETVRAAHNQALARSLAPEKRLLALSQLEWRVHTAADREFVLPDCVAIAANTGGETSPLFLAPNDGIERVWIPITKNQVLVGAKAATAAVPDELNRMSAQSSWQQFFGPTRDPVLIALVDQIGHQLRRWVRHQVSLAISNTE